jgi:hypothetical protein
MILLKNCWVGVKQQPLTQIISTYNEKIILKFIVLSIGTMLPVIKETKYKKVKKHIALETIGMCKRLIHSIEY